MKGKLVKLNSLQVIEVNYPQCAEYTKTIMEYWDTDKMRKFHKQHTKDLLLMARYKYKFHIND